MTEPGPSCPEIETPRVQLFCDSRRLLIVPVIAAALSEPDMQLMSHCPLTKGDETGSSCSLSIYYKVNHAQAKRAR